MAFSSSSSCFCLLTSTRPLFSTIRFQHTKPIVSHRPTSTSLSRAQSVTSSATQFSGSGPAVSRRSGNYKPCTWDDTFLQSLNNPYTGGMYDNKAQKLMGIVRSKLNNADEPVDQRLELIDSLERLGLDYHFEAEIKTILQQIFNNMSNDGDANSTLHTTSLKFRLLRDHGYYVSQDIFNSFRDENGGFKASVCNDVKGMLSLYEASFYGVEGESVMGEAMDVTSKYLKEAVKSLDDESLVKQVKHALEVPLRKRMERLEARWSIEAFERRCDTDPILIELAKLDYNRVQALFQDEVRDVSRWWKKSNIGKSLSFTRDRVVASYLWSTGIARHPQYGNCRRMIGEAVLLIGLLDDLYDVYGTLEELQLFTDAIERWDVLDAMKRLPEYMRIVYLALFNWVHEKAYDALIEQGCDIVSYLKNAWLLLLRAYLLEAKWYHADYAPTLEEYMNNGWVSITLPTVSILCYVLVNNPIVEKEIQFLESLPDILKWTSSIVRLEDDLGTSSEELKRGDVLKAIQCYMHETGTSEEVAREYVRQMVAEAWKRVNKYEFENTNLPKSSVRFVTDFSRVSHFVYQYGDGHGNEDNLKEMASKVLFDPIPLNYKGIDGAL